MGQACTKTLPGTTVGKAESAVKPQEHTVKQPPHGARRTDSANLRSSASFERLSSEEGPVEKASVAVAAVSLDEPAQCRQSPPVELQQTASHRKTAAQQALSHNLIASWNGRPFVTTECGPAPAPCQDDRVATVRGMKAHLYKKHDPAVDHILDLALNVFKAESAVVSLIDEANGYVCNGAGAAKGCTGAILPWLTTICGFIFIPANHEVLVVEDLHADARYKNVEGWPFARFYCGAPLIAANGHRLGTLCLGGSEPRHMDAAQSNILCNMAEMVVRKIERTWVDEQKQNTQMKLSRVFANYDASHMFVDTSTQQWQLMYLNDQSLQRLGLIREAIEGKGFWEVFTMWTPEGEELLNPAACFEAALLSGNEFDIDDVQLRASDDYFAGKGVSMHFRPAAKDAFDKHMQLIGIPSYVPPGSFGGGMYFVEVREASWSRNSSLASGSPSTCAALGASLFRSSALRPRTLPTEFEGHLELGQLLGKGSYGRVYRGVYKGQLVAVKVMDSDRVKLNEEGVAVEATITEGLAHSNLVCTLAHAMTAGPFTLNAAAPTLAAAFASSSGSGCASPPSPPPPASGLLRTGSRSLPDSFPRSSIDGEEWRGSAEAPGALQSMSGGTGGQRRGGRWDLPMLASTSIGGGSGQPLHLPASKPWDSAASRRDAGSRALQEEGQTWLLLDFCDMGSLQDGIEKGWLRSGRQTQSDPPNLPLLLATAQGIASACAFLHSKGIVHGDLTGGNVLLAKAEGQLGGFVAKVADFGLARSMDVQSRIQTAMYGTITHMPPELILEGHVSTAVDVYAFGVLLWEMYHGARAFAGLSHAQIMGAVATHHNSLTFQADVPLAFQALACSCMAADPDARPTFDQILAALLVLQAVPQAV